MTFLQTEAQVDKRKKIIRNVGVIFISIIVLLTFFSKTINNFLLPVVECKSAISGNLTKEIISQGEVVPSDIETIYSYGAWQITDVKVSEGDTISKGDALAAIDSDNIKLEIKKMELNLLKMENELKRYKNGFQAIDIEQYNTDAEVALKAVEIAEKKLNDQKELYAYEAVALESVNEAQDQLDTAKGEHEQKQKLSQQQKEKGKKDIEDYEITVIEKEKEIEVGRLELENRKRNIPAEGIIRSPLDGIVKIIPLESGVTTNDGQVLFEIIKKESGISIKWTLDGKPSREVNINDTVEFMAEKYEKINFSGTVKYKKYLAKEGIYEYVAEIKEAVEKLEIGQVVDISIKKSSQNYSVIVANSSVVIEGAKPYIYIVRTQDGIMGREDYVDKVEVKVLDTDDFNSAISNGVILDDDKIIVYSSKPLSDKIQVKLR